MKKIIVFLSFCFSFLNLNAQEMDTDSVLYLTAKEEAFMIDKECKFLLKLLPDLGVEFKLSPAFSMTVNFGIQHSLLPRSLDEIDNINTNFNYLALSSSVGIRYYYNMADLIKKGKQANNLTGKYIGFDFRLAGTDIDQADGQYISQSNSQSYRIVLGDQKRFLNSGYVDFQTRFSITNINRETQFSNEEFNFKNRVYTLSSGANVGFGLGKKYNIGDEIKCPIFKCHSDRHSALKIDRTRGFNLSMFTDDLANSKNRFSLSINPNIAYELKLFDSAWSLEQELSTFIYFSSFLENDKNKFSLSNANVSYKIGTKWYSQMKKKILRGQSGNNLSGQYLFGRFDYTYSYDKLRIINVSEPFPVSSSNQNHAVEFQAGIGFQKMVLDNLFFDYQIGFSHDLYNTAKPKRKFSLIGDFKIGVVF